MMKAIGKTTTKDCCQSKECFESNTRRTSWLLIIIVGNTTKTNNVVVVVVEAVVVEQARTLNSKKTKYRLASFVGAPP
jgi:hypothetical protein